jgi:CheY-like chemotaxis protein
MQSLRVLVVDDLRDSADTLAVLLQLWGHEATVAYDGRSALAVAVTQQFDVVVLDIGLPGRMDGYELARQLRRLPGMEKCLLIAITGYGQQSDVQRCQEAGIDRYFVKPVDPAELQEWLDRQREVDRPRK